MSPWKKNPIGLTNNKANNNNNALPIHLLCLPFVVFQNKNLKKTACNTSSILVPAILTKLDCKRMWFFSHTKGDTTHDT